MKLLKKKTIILMGMFLIGIFLTGCGEKEINLEDYLSVTYSGPNGYAVANVEFDYLSFGDAIVENSKKAGMSLMEIGIAADNVTIENNAAVNLSNNDTFTVTFNWDAAKAKELGLKYIGKEKTYTVQGLTDVIEIDPFKDVIIEYSGTAPTGKANIKNKSSDSFLSTLRYSASKTSELDNDEKIMVKIDTSDVEEKALENNIVLTLTEKEYVVEGLPYYVSTLSDIPDDMMEKMKKQTEDVIDAGTAEWDSNNEILGKKEFLGNYLLVKKSSNLYGDVNYCYCVYKINVKCQGEEFSYYYYVGFRDIIILEDGQCSVDLTDCIKPYGSALFGHVSGEAFLMGDKYYYIGYQELDSMFNNCVTKNIENYTYESTVTE